MVLHGIVLRSRDGLPLAASTDVDRNSPVNDCQKYIKLITKKLNVLPHRCTLRLQGFNIHVMSSMGLSCLTLCEEMYPSVLAFCFLNELQREFRDNCDYKKVLEAKRAYSFIEFELRMQKLKQSYNRPRTLTTQLNVAEMSAELRLQPPYEINEGDLGLAYNGILKPHQDTHHPLAIPGRCLVPLHWFGMLVAGLNVFCAVLNVVRGMAFIQHGHLDDEDMGAYTCGAAFLFCSCLYGYQIYLMVYMVRWRQMQTAIVLMGHISCIVYVSAFRNMLQTVFYSVIAMLASLLIMSRKQVQHLPGYSA